MLADFKQELLFLRDLFSKGCRSAPGGLGHPAVCASTRL